jgi:Tol biopolymer transport system component
MDQRELWVRRERDGAITRLTQGTTNWKWPVSGARPGIFYAMGGVSRREIDEVDSESGGFQPRYGHRALAEVIYSRDGKKSAFVTYPERSLCLPGKNGEPDVRLTDNRFEVHGAHFSPDGRQIAFMSLMDGRARVSVIPTIGGTPRELLSSSEDQGIPTWSADGRFIVFGELLDRKDRNSMRIRRYDTVLNTVTDLPDSVGLWSPRWSPDGRFISAVSTDERQMRLFDVRESHWRVLASLGHFENQAWTPDSRYLLGVGSIAEKGPEVIRVRISNGKAEPVAEFGEGAFADWIGPTPDGSVLACRRVQMNDIYEIKLDLP